MNEDPNDGAVLVGSGDLDIDPKGLMRTLSIEQLEKLEEMVRSQMDLPEEFSKSIEEHFWELL